MDTRHWLIEYQEMFHEHHQQCFLYPHEVVKEAQGLMDVRAFDHSSATASFAECGLI